MSSKKFELEFKMRIVQLNLKRDKSVVQLAREFSISEKAIQTWTLIYHRDGPAGFIVQSHNKSYTKEFKATVVQEYLKGANSYLELALKYQIPAYSTIHNWVKQYNSHKELQDYDPKGAVFMTPNRKTTLEERIEIVKYCLDHNREYKLAAAHFDVAYAQVYQWVKKFEKSGEETLVDHRGKRKPDEQLNEVERLKRENERLKRALELKERETILLKKVKEFERRRYSPKGNKNPST
jgi:transposase